MGDSNALPIVEVWLNSPGIQAEGELRSSFHVAGDKNAPGKGYTCTMQGNWVRLSKPGVFLADVPREYVRAVIYKPEVAK